MTTLHEQLRHDVPRQRRATSRRPWPTWLINWASEREKSKDDVCKSPKTNLKKRVCKNILKAFHRKNLVVVAQFERHVGFDCSQSHHTVVVGCWLLLAYRSLLSLPRNSNWNVLIRLKWNHGCRRNRRRGLTHYRRMFGSHQRADQMMFAQTILLQMV